MTSLLDYQTVKNLKKPGRYTDALIKGLHLWVKPNGKKYWIFRYSLANKQHNISLATSAVTTNASKLTLAYITYGMTANKPQETIKDNRISRR